ncbi:unnamed protein product [Mytilus edulis]|uniref:Carboxylesterase type B domain-containing protein n=1 Tax=Mytilus edulis TaxID=6550 RepID=A0A8S3UST8_MYTED|nr:unnamed protein product [Mytilus edulis]
MLTIVFGNSTAILKTKLGNIKGISSTFTFDNYTRNYNEFRNIPFAKPPVGDLRFHQPIPYGGWESNAKSVIIWVHGGGYYLGQGMFYDGSYLSGIGDNVYLNLPFAPVVDGVFLKQSPQNILYGKPSPELEFYKSLDFIFGACELEGIAIPYGIREIQNRLSFNISDGVPSDYFRNHIIPVVVEQYFNNNSALASDIYKQFLSTISQDQAINVVNLYSDLFFYFPEIFSLKSHASGNHNIKQYLYSFRTRTMFSNR